MTRTIPFTKAKLRKAIDVAREKGLRLVVRPSGELVFEREDNPQREAETVERDHEVVL